MSLPETSKSAERREATGFVARYLTGIGVDVGYKGNGITNPTTVVPWAIPIDLETPGYDGRNLPHTNLDFVFSSHMLEHVDDYVSTIKAWYDALKVGGHMVIVVPHKFLYEKREKRPSRWNADHRRFYTPASLLGEVEQALPPNSYRVRHLMDNDEGFDYSIGPDRHSGGCYEIELVVQKIVMPTWSLAP